ncbi:MAG: SdiA-regulated domain-containing protein [Thermodesulfobacteriota bacterium]
MANLLGSLQKLTALTLVAALPLMAGCGSSGSSATNPSGSSAMTEPSGLTVSSDGTTLWTVSDNNGDLYKLDTQGNILDRYGLAGDSEGVSYDFTSETLWVVNESNQTVRNYNLDGTAAGSAEEVLPANGNGGLEGIAVCDDRIFVVQEKDPGLFLELGRNLAEVSREELDFSGNDYSGLACDRYPAGHANAGEFTDKLWIVSHKANALYLADVSAMNSADKVLDFATAFEQVEGVAYDYNNELLYVIDDARNKLGVYDASDKANLTAIRFHNY